jgi:hypothetical protein
MPFYLKPYDHCIFLLVEFSPLGCWNEPLLQNTKVEVRYLVPIDLRGEPFLVWKVLRLLPRRIFSLTQTLIQLWSS